MLQLILVSNTQRNNLGVLMQEN